ncbi:PA14 domain-containing protein [Streptomyces sp. NPDC048629]|uniref:fibronectin type III domain-containing protein n=1 Tax=Streptomyces sp. NPDC048629 TaxID=3154824 RepID=UPI00341DC56B
MTRNRLGAAALTAALATAGGLLTATPASAVTCTSPVWTAQYFANTSFSGTPKLTACDSAIAENMGSGDPAGVTLPNDNFSVRWQLTRDFGSGGPFTFNAATQDGMRVYVDGVRKIDLWKNVSTTARKTLDLSIPAGKHTIRVDYVAWTGYAYAGFTYAPRTATGVDTVKPLYPTGLTATYNTTTLKTTLRWAANKEMDLAGYRVYRRLSTAQWAKVSGTSLLTTPTFVDTPPTTGQTYLYEVRAVDKAGNESAGSLDVTAKTADLTGPVAPTGLTVSVGDGWWATLNWQAVSDAAKYEVYASSAATGPFELLGSTTTATYRADAPANTTRYYRVRALDALGNPGAYATVTSDGVDRMPPGAPTGVYAGAVPGATSVSWTAPGGGWYEDWDNGGHYRVYRSPGKTFDPAARTQVTCDEEQSNEASNRGTCVDLGMPMNTYVTYAVTAVDPGGNESAYSTPVVVRTGDTVAPGPVTGVKVTPRADGMVVSWAASPEDDIDEYVVWKGVREADGTVKWLGPDSCWDNPSNPLATLCGDLPDGTKHVYAVVAVDRWNNKLHPSDPKVTVVEATELDVRPSVTVTKNWTLGALGHGTTITTRPTVTWKCTDTAVCDTVAGYRVSRWNPAAGAYQPQHEGLLPTTTGMWEDATATKQNTYFYTLEAVTADGTVVGTYPWYSIFRDWV